MPALDPDDPEDEGPPDMLGSSDDEGPPGLTGMDGTDDEAEPASQPAPSMPKLEILWQAIPQDKPVFWMHSDKAHPQVWAWQKDETGGE